MERGDKGRKLEVATGEGATSKEQEFTQRFVLCLVGCSLSDSLPQCSEGLKILRERTIVLIFLGLFVITALFATDSIYGVLAGIVVLFVMGIVWVLTQSRGTPEPQQDPEP